MQAQLTTEERIAKMTLDEAYEWIRKSHSIYHTNDQPLIDAAKVIVEGHEEKVRREAKMQAEHVQPNDEEAAWNALPWYKKIIPFALGLVDLVTYGVTDLFTATVFWKVKRWHIGALLVILALVFFGGRGVSNFFKNRAIANADPQSTVVVDPAELLNAAPQADLSGVSVPDPSTLLQQPLATAAMQNIVDCTAATCPDAQQYIANYQGKTGPAGSATLRASCDKGAKVLGEIPKGTPVWVITSTISLGSYCENGECRRGMIKPIAALPFTHQGGCISLTAAQPVSP